MQTQDDSNNTKLIFVVGSSRSGTTLMSRILGRNSFVYSFHELHFFESLWSKNFGSLIESDEAEKLLSQLLAIQRQGYLSKKQPRQFLEEAHAVIDTHSEHTASNTFARFLYSESARFHKKIPCDHTPRNLFYIDDILREYPNARVLCMLRDPRDVLLSQKNKWRRRSLGGSNIPRSEAFRAWLNYHPLTVTRLWQSAVNTIQRHKDNPKVMVVHFEKLVSEPRANVEQICKFLGIRFEREMLNVPRVGSSLQADTKSVNEISAAHAGAWRKGGLTSTEIYICEWAATTAMNQWGYRPTKVKPSWTGLFLMALWFPFHLAAAIIANISRMRSPVEALRRRLA